MANFRQVYINFALMGLFTLAIISFVYTIQADNTTGDTILNDPLLNSSFNSLESDLNNLQDEANSSRESYESDIPDRGFGSLLIFAITGVGKTFTGGITGIYNILIDLPASKLGIPPVVFSVLGSILMVSLVLLTWRVYRSGS